MGLLPWHHNTAVVRAFTTVPTSHNTRRPQPFLVRQSATDDHNNNNNDNAAATNAPLSRDEVQTILDAIPVFAVTSGPGLVLLKDKAHGDQEFGHFFFSPQAANALYQPLKQQQQQGDDNVQWDITSYPLGLIWFELLHPATEPQPEKDNDDTNNNNNATVQYRLVPEADARAAARALVEASARQSGSFLGNVPDLFAAPFDEIPIFMDQFLRLQPSSSEDNVEKFPLYFRYTDLMATLQQASAEQPDDSYQAALSVVDLQTLVAQMMAPDSANNYRNTLLVPPSPPLDDDKDDDEPEQPEASSQTLVVSTLTATESWKD
eukprot:CAMPEP_0168745504 /NCGR_PEP_ID=MMETSP0724-20121128/14652_1 /TAXON_ID=265536 /ORGANISM="Amphiprora sp., Strain CCMP467" /LENGTH=319 /DNA_ID=CAMNT_0008793219 /DNA_START=44 /DNA_END=1003 /DNA_ORIENTATION=-